ncbi:MAG TPA: hypothetical protein PLG21_10495, partial [Anaerolineae bacterium]|nr:hypothetical protein [Anaerolineae bacterium]
RLLEVGVPADAILVLVPQRTLGRRYLDALRLPAAPAGAHVDVLTIGGLAQRAVELYWPLVAGPAGFAQPTALPVFLTLETAQYYMDRLIEPFVAAGAFGDVTLARQRLISQILDNLNKAATAGFAYSEIGARLAGAWSGESSRLRVYEQVQACANSFRRFCLEHNLLDFSLQIEVFARYVLALPEAASALAGRYRHLIVDNVEEDVPVSHDLVGRWLAGCTSALVIYDEQGGLRSYLGADPAGALALRERCAAHERWDGPPAPRPALLALAAGLARSLGFASEVPGAHACAPGGGAKAPTTNLGDLREAVTLISETYHTDAIRSVVGEIARLVEGEGVSPGHITVLAPFMGDALRFALSTALARRGVPSYSQRPSRAVRDEPAARCLLTLARLAHPDWGPPCLRTDVAHALVAAIDEMDLVRALHLTAIVYRTAGGQATLATFEQVRAEEQLKVTYLLGNRYEALRRWLAAYAAGPAQPLDHFWARLFDELLSQPGYVFHHDRDSAAVTAHLIESARRFRQTVAGPAEDADGASAASFVAMVEQGVIAAQYVPPAEEAPDAVLLAPAYTFAMGDRPADYQFWLDLASSTWGRRLYQPLTHPYVLTRHWPPGKPWTDADEDLANRQALYRLIVGLVRRCGCHIYVADSVYNERGFEEHGPLQQAAFRALRRAVQTVEGHDG